MSASSSAPKQCAGRGPETFPRENARHQSDYSNDLDSVSINKDLETRRVSVPQHTLSPVKEDSHLPSSPAELRYCAPDDPVGPSRPSGGSRTRPPSPRPFPLPLGWLDTPGARCTSSGPSGRDPPAHLWSGPRDRGREKPDAHRPGHDETERSLALSEEEDDTRVKLSYYRKRLEEIESRGAPTACLRLWFVVIFFPPVNKKRSHWGSFMSHVCKRIWCRLWITAYSNKHGRNYENWGEF